MARTAATDDSSLKRLGGGRWQTRDERFTIEPQSGTWVVVDAEQTDDLGLPLVRGPFRSLGDAKDAIGEARSSPPAASPLADRLTRPRSKEAPGGGKGSKGRQEAPAATAPSPKPAPAPAPARAKTRKAKPSADESADEPAEPRWIAALEPGERRQARRLLARLEAADAPDPEGMARRDIVGDVAAVASFAIGRALEDLGPDATPAKVAALLVEGRDEDLGVRWRLVDDDGRPITLDRRLRR